MLLYLTELPPYPYQLQPQLLWPLLISIPSKIPAPNDKTPVRSKSLPLYPGGACIGAP